MKKTVILFGILSSLSITMHSSGGKESLEKVKKEPQEVSEQEFNHLKWRVFEDPEVQCPYRYIMPEVFKRQEKLLDAMHRYKKLTPEIEAAILGRHRKALQYAWENNKTDLYLINQVAQVRAPNGTTALKYRTWQAEIASVRKMYPSNPRYRAYTMHCNPHGWTDLLTDFACGNNVPFITTLAQSAREHDANFALAYGYSFRSRLRCFVFRTPFAKEHRPLVQKAHALEPYTSLHYLHASDHAPLLIASVLVRDYDDIDKKFAQELFYAHHSGIHVFNGGQAAAFLEYVDDVLTDNPELKTTCITSNLGEFFKERDEFLEKSKIINTLIASTDLVKIIVACLTDFPLFDKKSKTMQASNQLLITEEDLEEPVAPTSQLIARLNPAIAFFTTPSKLG